MFYVIFKVVACLTLATSFIVAGEKKITRTPKDYTPAFRAYLKGFSKPLPTDPPEIRELMLSKGKPPKLIKSLRKTSGLLKKGDRALGNTEALKKYKITFFKRHPWAEKVRKKYNVTVEPPQSDWSEIKTYIRILGSALKITDAEARAMEKDNPERYKEFVGYYLRLVWVIDFIATHGTKKEKERTALYLEEAIYASLTVDVRPIEVLAALDFPAVKHVFWPFYAAQPENCMRHCVNVLGDAWGGINRRKPSPHHVFMIRFHKWVLTEKRLPFKGSSLRGYASSLYTRCVGMKAYRYAIFIHHYFPQVPLDQTLHQQLTKALFKLDDPENLERNWKKYQAARESMYKITN